MTFRLIIVLAGLMLSSCGMDQFFAPTILTNNQDLERYQARLGEKINLTVVLATNKSFVQPGETSRKAYGILYGSLGSNSSDCFNLRENPITTSTTPFCPVMPKYFKGIMPDVTASAPAKAVELTYNSSTAQWVGTFQIEAVELCTDPPGCPSILVGFYGASTSDPKAIFPLVSHPTDSVAIFVNP